MIEVHPKMTNGDTWAIYERHGFNGWSVSEFDVATVLGGLEAELAEWEAAFAPGLNEPQPGLTVAQSKQIYARHGLTWGSSYAEITLTLGGLEAELAAKDELVVECWSEIARLEMETASLANQRDALRRDCQELEHGRAMAEAVTLDAEAKLEQMRQNAHAATNEYAGELWAWRAWAVSVGEAVDAMDVTRLESLVAHMPNPDVAETMATEVTRLQALVAEAAITIEWANALMPPPALHEWDATCRKDGVGLALLARLQESNTPA